MLGDETGVILEKLADYVLSCMPGCRTARRQRTASTDYDIVCSMEGFEVYFRSEFGRYFVCECKDLKVPAGYPIIAKFSRVLDSTKSKVGVLFSVKGITGRKTNKYAERERIKLFQDRGISILVVDENDLNAVAQGHSLIHLLRIKYEALRLDLPRSHENL